MVQGLETNYLLPNIPTFYYKYGHFYRLNTIF